MMVSREDHRRPIGICGDRKRVAVENDSLEVELVEGQTPSD